MDERHAVEGKSNEAGSEWVRLHPSWAAREIERRSCLDMLMSRFGIDSVLVSVPQLARALGMSRSTIYSRLDADDFFIPHRNVGRSPVFTVDDVVTWYLSGGKRAEPAGRAANGAGQSERCGRDAASIAMTSGAESGRRERDMAVDAMVAKAMARIGADRR